MGASHLMMAGQAYYSLPFVHSPQARARELRLPLRFVESFRVCALDDATKTSAQRFIESWSIDDVYDRFGTLGSNAREWLTTELLRGERPALVALHADRVVGLLDYVYAQGAIHFGIVVDSRYRRSSIGSHLLAALLRLKTPAHPVAAECRIDNRPAVALLRGSQFQCTCVERHEMIWQHA